MPLILVFFMFTLTFKGVTVITQDTRIFKAPDKKSVHERRLSPDVFLETNKAQNGFVKVWDFSKGWVWIPEGTKRKTVEVLFLLPKDSLEVLIRENSNWKEKKVSFDRLNKRSKPLGTVTPDSLILYKGEHYLLCHKLLGFRKRWDFALPLKQLTISKIATVLPVVDRQFQQIKRKPKKERKKYARWFNWLDVMSRNFPDSFVAIFYETEGFYGPFRKVALRMLIRYWVSGIPSVGHRRLFQWTQEFLEKHERDTLMKYEWWGIGGLWVYLKLKSKELDPSWDEDLFDLLPYAKEPITQAGFLLLLADLKERKGDTTSALEIFKDVALNFPKAKQFTFKEYGFDLQKEAWYRLLNYSLRHPDSLSPLLDSYVEMLNRNPIIENYSSRDIIAQATFLGPLSREKTLKYLYLLRDLNKKLKEDTLHKARQNPEEFHFLFPGMPFKYDPDSLIEGIISTPSGIQITSKSKRTSLFTWPDESLMPFNSFHRAELLYPGPRRWLKVKTEKSIGWVLLDSIGAFKLMAKSLSPIENVIPFCDSLLVAIPYGDKVLAVSKHQSAVFTWDAQEGRVIWSLEPKRIRKRGEKPEILSYFPTKRGLYVLKNIQKPETLPISFQRILLESFLIQWKDNRLTVKDIEKGKTLKNLSIDEDDEILRPIIARNWLLVPTRHKFLYLFKI